MKRCVLVGVVILTLGAGNLPAASDAPTYIDDVQPILAENCADCHRPSGSNVMGMVAPMPLRTFAEVRPWAKSIARNVKERLMPPWHASSDFDGVFMNQRTLEEEEIATIVRWASTGAPKGEGTEISIAGGDDGWQIGEPDLIVAFDEP